MVGIMARTRTPSRLQKIEDKRNRQQAVLFGFLSVGFLLLLIFVGVPLFIKAAIFLGDLRSQSQGVDKNDTIPPVPPRIVSNFEATSSAKIDLYGFAEPGAKVSLYRNTDKHAEIVSDSDGNFSFTDVKLMGGENLFYAVAADASGNESQPSADFTIVFDNEAPDLTLTSPEDGSEYYDEEREILVAGETEPDTNVRVNGYVVAVDTEGNFVKRLQLADGENEIEVIARDEAGNETSKTVTVTYIQ